MDLIKSLIQLEKKSIVRSKCLKYAVLPLFCIIPFALFILGSTRFDYNSLLLFWTCILLAFPVIALSPLSFSKDGYYYPALMTKKIPLDVYVKGKVLFIILCSFFYYVALTPFIIQYKFIIVLAFYAGIVYYVPFVLVIIMLKSSYEKHKIYLNGSPFLNLEGISIVKAILGFPIVLPLFFWNETVYWGIGSMFVVGILGLIQINFSIGVIAKNLARRKYLFLDL